MENDIKFVYAVKQAEQMAFDGVNRRVDAFATKAHIAHQGSIMCSVDEQGLKIAFGARAVRKVQYRPEGLVVCEECERLYKANTLLPWRKWSEGVLDEAR
jgi:hypothetical protein